MKYLYQARQLVRQAHFLSLDVVVGAVLSHLVAARLPDGHQPVNWPTTVLLAICVFLIYAADRLLDVRKASTKTRPFTPRHRYHAAQAARLVRLLAVLAILAIILLFWLPRGVLWFGVVLALICGLYVWGVSRLPALHKALVWKEPIVAVLYTIGVWGSAWAHKPTVLWSEIGLAVLFLLIAFQNLVLFSLMEAYELPTDSYSLATLWGKERSDTVLRTLAVLVTVLSLVVFFLADDRFAQRMAIIEGLMSGVLYVIQRYPRIFLGDQRYRWIGDGIFWLPLLIL